jgi:cytosine/adenosine deaminase-related metal-dependent hydrolase
MMRSRRILVTVLVVCAVAAVDGALRTATAEPGWDPSSGILIKGATVATMDDVHTIVPHGNVLVRDGLVVAIWRGPKPPSGVTIGDATVIKAGPNDLLFPGLINLHSHPNFNVVHTWPAPSSHAMPGQGKSGTDPYANRYQWGATVPTAAPPELLRLVNNPVGILGDPLGLGLAGEMVKYAETTALLAGTTAIQGAHPDPESDGVLVRNVDNGAFDGRIAPPWVPPVDQLGGTDLSDLLGAMQAGSVDAWIVHLAEGVRDAGRRPGDPVSSRAEFATLKAKGLLTDMTVIVHGTALERPDFAEMRAAPSIRAAGTGDGLGAKLVWSPLSNLLLYGTMTNVFEAKAEDVLVSLGTDWTPSGSLTLLDELKVANVALRDARLLGSSRELVPEFSLAGTRGPERQEAEAALDRWLVDMVTRNPAQTLRWDDRVGSIEPGMVADLLLIRPPPNSRSRGLPRTVYRDLIEATQREVELVLVGGDPLAGELSLISLLKPGDHEIVGSAVGRFVKAVDTTTTAPVPEGDESLAELAAELEAGLTALGGDSPPPAGGPGPPSNTYSYLKQNVAGGAVAGLPDELFFGLLADNVGLLPDGSLNLERVQLVPLFTGDDDFRAHLLRGDIDPVSGLVADLTPPFALYPANLNHIGPLGNPLATVTP